VVLKSWLIFSKQIIKNFTRKNKNFLQKSLLFIQKTNQNIDRDVNHNCPQHPNLGQSEPEPTNAPMWMDGALI
jgi:hypothetical protein